MANNENLIPIPGRLHSVATEGHISGANEIYDDTLQKDQATINSENSTALEGKVDKEEGKGLSANDYSDTEKAKVSSHESALAAGGSVDTRIAAAVNTLDAEASQVAGSDGLSLSVSEVDGKITSISGSIASNTYDAYGVAAIAKTELLGDAATDYNTLGKCEDKIQANASDIDDLEALVPTQATSSNQLADKAFVNSSVSTATATFRGTSEAGLSEVQFLSWANGLTKDLNDYVFWNTEDATGNTQYKRYKYDGTQWAFEYTLNNSSFTAAQWAAIESGMTETLKDKLVSLPTSAEISQEINAEAVARASADSAINTTIGTDSTSGTVRGRIKVLEDAVGTGGSVDSRISSAVNAAKSEIKGNATSACDTLGEAEALITAEATARDNAVSAEATRAQAAEGALQQLYENLTQSDIVVVADHTQVASPVANTIYREQGTNTYSDWMYQNSSWNKMAEYDNAIDDEPIVDSDNLVKSGGVFDAVGNIEDLEPIDVQNGLISLQGTFVSNASFRVRKYAVNAGDVYFFNLTKPSSTSGFPYVYWYDSNGNPFSYSIYQRDGDTTVYTDYPIKAPDNAAFVTTSLYYTIEPFVVRHADGVVKSIELKRRLDTLDSVVMRTRGVLPSCDLDTVIDNGIWLIIDGNVYNNVPNNNRVGFLRVSNTNGDWILQEYMTLDGSQLYQRRIHNEEATQWVRIGEGNTYNVENIFNEYQQTVNLQATPSITTDTNNYLASTNNTADRTADILAMLQATGVCNLGPGIFWIDSLIMPDNTTLIGCGAATNVYLVEGDNKFAIKMGSRCMVSKMQLWGNASIIAPTEEGTRHGIVWQGNYTQNPNSDAQPMFGIISDVQLRYFNGGAIYCYDTGYGTYNHLSVTNVDIFRCYAGIYVKYWSEYHKFTNVRCSHCYYGCINNGGNNIFTNCDFSSSQHVAFLMDNSQGQSPNNSHGSAIGCVFNHTYENGVSNAGVGVKILNCNNGFVFNGCQIFFSKIQIENTAGIVFDANNFGYSNCNILVNGGGVILFSNNIHQDTPTISITDNNKVHFVNCYNRTTGEVIQQ